MQEPLPDNLMWAKCLETLPTQLAPARTPEQRELVQGSLLTGYVLLCHMYSSGDPGPPCSISQHTGVHASLNKGSLKIWWHWVAIVCHGVLTELLEGNHFHGTASTPCCHCKDIDHCSEVCTSLPPTIREPDLLEWKAPLSLVSVRPRFASEAG